VPRIALRCGLRRILAASGTGAQPSLYHHSNKVALVTVLLGVAATVNSQRQSTVIRKDSTVQSFLATVNREQSVVSIQTVKGHFLHLRVKRQWSTINHLSTILTKELFNNRGQQTIPCSRNQHMRVNNQQSTFNGQKSTNPNIKCNC
jgi:hypothetical protein